MKADINSPLVNDNRSYDYSSHPEEERKEYDFISSCINTGAKVIDLGCGNGSLLIKLINEKGVSAKGIELSKSGVEICKKKGLDVIEGRIDEKLPFADNEFDYSICNVTIQMVNYPEALISEMKRISRYQIISFPNFAFYKNRFDLLLKGRMPKPMLFGYKWYSTGHIHQLSVNDFFELLDDTGGLHLVKSFFEPSNSRIKNYFIKRFPNLFQVLMIFLFEKK
jgi:methionine biosynthesis protein MetW